MNAFAIAFSQAFINDLSELHEQVLEKQEDSTIEIVFDSDIILAMNILNYIEYNNIADIFLSCASINLINAYMKQPEKKLNYAYKMKLIDLLRGIKHIEDPHITLSYDNSANMQLLIVNFVSFQFSFQAARFSELTKALTKNNKTQWDGIRKQRCASTVFHYALNCNYISNKTRKGRVLRQFLDNELLDFNKGCYEFRDGDLIKTCNFIHGEDERNEYLKDYMRIKLCEPRSEPVILLGTFEKTWPKHVTFVYIRPYINGIRAITLCDHINLYRKTLEEYIDVNSLQRGKVYYIIGYCRQYTDGSGRMGVTLAKNLNSPPIAITGNLKSFDKNVFEKCYTFSPEDYTTRSQKYIKP